MSRFFPKDIAELVHWYERFISPISLVAGFISDNLFLTRRVDLLQTNLLFGFYLILSAFGIITINLIESGRVRDMRIVRLTPVVPIIIQFCMGGLFSGFLSLYSRSASLAVGWIFVFVLAAMLLGNERLARFYVRIPVQVGVYFGVLFSFLIFFLPVIFHQIGPTMFRLSGATALLGISLFIWLLARLVPDLMRTALPATIASIVGVFVTINALYFANLLPPLPLALKEAGVYHMVVHEAGVGYVVTEEPVPWYQYYLNYSPTYHAVAGEPVYVFTSVFAPAGLSISVEHQWQHYDTTQNTWVTVASVTYPMSGGRDGGYGGYSLKGSPAPGRWRVNVLTQYGQLIGSVSFSVVEASSTPPTISKIE